MSDEQLGRIENAHSYNTIQCNKTSNCTIQKRGKPVVDAISVEVVDLCVRSEVSFGASVVPTMVNSCTN